MSIDYAPSGRYLASAGLDKTVRIWDVESQQPVKTLTGHEGGVLCVAFSPDGKRLASGSTDTTVLIWDVEAALEQTRDDAQ